MIAAQMPRNVEWTLTTMRNEKSFIVRPDDNELRDRELDVVEHQPYDPAAYQNEAGWLCEDMSGDTYFISEGGRVDKADEYKEIGDDIWEPKTWTIHWGECPEILDRWQRLIDRDEEEL